jgi:hypothetical protein
VAFATKADANNLVKHIVFGQKIHAKVQIA